MKDESVDIFPLYLSPQGSRDKASAAHGRRSWPGILSQSTACLSGSSPRKTLPMSSH
ncbi:hypothetical protein K439DRAFT_1636703, partial [Ramaria rubella]